MAAKMDRVDGTIKKWYKSIPGQFKTAFLSAVLFGLAAHMYMFTNKLPNSDDLLGVDGFGATFRLGRWFLWVVGAAAYHLNLVVSVPWFNGMVTVLLLACAAGIIAVLLDIRSSTANVLLGAAFVTFPSWTATFFYMFTAPYYALAVLMAVLSVAFAAACRKGCVPSVLLLACSMGIYQAYLPFTATLYVVLLFLMLYDEGKTYMDILKKAIYYLVNLAGGVLLYYAAMRASLAVTHQSLDDYKGVSSMGQLSISRIPEILQNIFVNFFGVFLNNNLEISYNLITKGMYFVLFLVTLFAAAGLAHALWKKGQRLKAAETAVLLLVYVLAVNGIFIMAAEGIYSLMYFSYVFMLIFPLALLDRGFALDGKCFKNCAAEWAACFVLLCGIVSYCQYAGAQYLSIELSFEQAKSYYTTMVTQIKNTDGYTDTCKVAFAGSAIEDNSLYHNEVLGRFDMSGRDSTLADAYSKEFLLRYYCGFDAEFVGTEGIAASQIDAMAVYPAAGSVKVIDGVAVIKLSED